MIGKSMAFFPARPPGEALFIFNPHERKLYECPSNQVRICLPSWRAAQRPRVAESGSLPKSPLRRASLQPFLEVLFMNGTPLFAFPTVIAVCASRLKIAFSWCRDLLVKEIMSIIRAIRTLVFRARLG